MLFKIFIVSDEADQFQREITIDADATFLDLNNAILKCCNYADDQITVFHICDEDWEPKVQICREDMGTSPADCDIYVMDKAILRDFISEEGQQLDFVFDTFNNRMFYLKVKETITGQNLETPQCTLSVGKAPQQIVLPDMTSSGGNDVATDYEDLGSFGDEDGFDPEDFDPEGFEIEEL